MAWIQLLIGKKHLLGIDKLVAISSTGFLPEATGLAKECGLNVFTMSRISEPATQEFLRFSSFAVCVHRCADVEADLRFPEDRADLADPVIPSVVVDGGTPIQVRVYSPNTCWGDRPWTRAPMETAERVSVVLQLPEFSAPE